MAVTNKEKKDIARQLYISGWTLQKISERLGTHTNTLTTWKGKEDWDTLKGALAVTPLQIHRNLLQHAASISESPSLSNIADLNAIANFLRVTQANVPGVVEKITIMEEFTEFLLKECKDLEAAKLVSEYGQRFISQELTGKK